MFVCDTCQHKFASKSTLWHHRKSAKYCLKMRGEQIPELLCTGCGSVFTRKPDLNRHGKNCKVNKTKQIYEKRINTLVTENTKYKEREVYHLNTISKLESQVSVLQDRLATIAEKAATKPTTINTRINKQVNQLLPLTQEYIESQVPNLTIDHIKRGAQGYADFAFEFALKDRIMCTDFSRRRGKYKDEDGNVIDDPEMKKVSKQFFQAIHDHNTTLTNQYGQELYNKLTDILQNAGDELTQEETDKLQLTQQRILQEISKVNTSRIDVTDIAKGKKSDLLPEFVKEVCALSS